jgi:hypothetical protein
VLLQGKNVGANVGINFSPSPSAFDDLKTGGVNMNLQKLIVQ